MAAPDLLTMQFLLFQRSPLNRKNPPSSYLVWIIHLTPWNYFVYILFAYTYYLLQKLHTRCKHCITNLPMWVVCIGHWSLWCIFEKKSISDCTKLVQSLYSKVEMLLISVRRDKRLIWYIRDIEKLQIYILLITNALNRWSICLLLMM